MKVVINACYGGFGLSAKAMDLYVKAENIVNPEDFYVWDIKRNDPTLVKIVEELGEEANGEYADLKIVEIPGDVQWHIADYDGSEWVAENHRTWS